MKRFQEVFTVGIGQAWIVECYFGNPGYTAEKDILETWLRSRSHRNRVAITAEACRNP